MKKLLIAILILIPAFADATDISQLPINSLSTVKPNIIIGYDDSGSMALTYLPDSATSLTNQQEASWNYNPLAFDPAKTYLPWIKTVKTTAAAVRYPNASITPYSGSVFTSDGTSAVTSGTLFSGGTYKVTYTCPTGVQTAKEYPTNTVFASKTACTNANALGSFYTLGSNYTVQTGQSWQKGDVLATYYQLENSASAVDNVTYFSAITCPAGDLCSSVPASVAGYRLVRKTIASTNTIQLQNYANWKVYASTRKYMVSSAMSDILPGLAGITMGFQPFNSSSTTNSNTKARDPSVTNITYNGALSGSVPGYYAKSGRMFNLDYPADVNILLDLIYNTESGSATPTHANLNTIGLTFQNASLALTLNDDTGYNASGRKGVVQYACQKNAAFIVTDGYANQSAYPAPPAYAQSTWGASVPFKTTTAKSLADLGLAYYTINSRTDLAAGKVPADTLTKDCTVDSNTNLHMNTYALTLGVHGDLFGSTTYPTVTATANACTTAPTWINPTTATNNTKQIDDLWHATINGRGQMFSADNPDDLVTYVKAAFMDIIFRAGSQSAIAVANVNMTQTNDSAYGSSFNPQTWFGDVQKFSVNLSTGEVNNTTPIWSARDQLDTKAWATRKIFTLGEDFGTTIKPTLPSGSETGATVATLINYLKGDRSNEINGTNVNQYYRLRTHVLGDAINAEPLIVNGMVYQATNDGMIHAFNETNGSEVWAYVPSQNIPSLGNLSLRTYNHQYFVDGTPIAGVYDKSSGDKTLLVGGLGAGSFGYYAVDVTTPTVPVAKWEFPKNSNDAKNGGLTSISKPRIIATKDSSHPYVVVVVSGYNNGSGTVGGVVQSGGDGKGHIWILDPASGNTIKEMVTSAGSTSAPVGLSTFAAYVADATADNRVSYMYGGDELGNVWKIDTTGNSIGSWTISKFAAIGRPITVKPEISTTSLGNPIILFGTGRLFGSTDLVNTDIQGFYAIQDWRQATATTIVPTDLTKLDASGGDAQDRVISLTGACKSWNDNGNIGWRFDFPQGGERVVGDPKIGLGHIAFNSNLMSANACSSASYAYWLSLNNSSSSTCSVPGSGSNMGKYLGGYTASRPVLISLPNGKIEILTHLGTGKILTTDTGEFSLVNTKIRSWRTLQRPMR
jgi:type IV pilus assembly protein PilY1